MHCRLEDTAWAELQDVLQCPALPPHLRNLYQGVVLSKAGQYPPWFEDGRYLQNFKVSLADFKFALACVLQCSLQPCASQHGLQTVMTHDTVQSF